MMNLRIGNLTELIDVLKGEGHTVLGRTQECDCEIWVEPLIQKEIKSNYGTLLTAHSYNFCSFI
jgi:hypothetical protein